MVSDLILWFDAIGKKSKFSKIKGCGAWFYVIKPVSWRLLRGGVPELESRSLNNPGYRKLITMVYVCE